jgi:maleylpyruvate isomerase
MADTVPTHDEVLAALAEATALLQRSAAELRPEQVAEPSLLPGWSRGHVLTHVSRNADAIARVLAGAARGEQVPMYPSIEAREADIAAGAGRPLAEQLTDLRESARALDEEITALPGPAWSFGFRHHAGDTLSMEQLLWKRLGEVEYHHVDLDAGYTPAHWPAAFVVRELEMLLPGTAGDPEIPALELLDEDTGLSHRLGGPEAKPELTVAGPADGLLAWLSGRAAGDGLTVHRDGVRLADARAALPTLPPLG